MRNTVMTGPIILSKEDSSRLRQNILHPTVEYLQEQERYFEEIASSMIIHKEGSNTRVEFKDLDLSNLDLMIEKEKNAAPVQVLMRASAYISLEAHVETQPGPEENSAVVVLNLLIGKKDDSSPFFIEAEEAALFRWNPEKVDAEHSEKLLKQNAPALLLSYLRPTISLITSASPYAAYDIPFMNFTE